MRRYAYGKELWPPTRPIFRLRRGRLVRVHWDWLRRDKPGRRQYWGTGASGRLDWERQCRIMKMEEHNRGWRTSHFYRATMREKFDRADRRYLRATIDAGLIEREGDLVAYRARS